MQQLNSFGEIKICKEPLVITHVRISLYRYFNEKIGDKLAQFKNLKSFECQGTNFFESQLAAVLNLPKLERLVLPKGFVKEIDYTLTNAAQLRILDLSKNLLSELPIFLRELKSLEELILDGNSIDELDDVLLDLPKLKVLSLTKLGDKKLPSFLMELIPRLSELSLPKGLSTKLIKKYPKLYAQLPYLSMNTSLENKYSAKMRQYFYENDTDWEMRAFYFNLLAGNEEKIAQQATIEKFLSAANFPVVEAVRLKALEYLQGQIPTKANAALQKQASVVVMGKLGINKNELRQKLKDHDIKYEARISKKTTHCLLGQSPGDAAFEALEKGLYLITEKYILDYWEEVENPYLLEAVEEAPEQADNIAALLLSGQEDSMLVALSMFKQGGFPKELITELFIAYQILATKSEAKREAERLLRQYGSVELMHFLKQDYLFLIRSNTHTMRTRLAALNDKTELDGLKIAQYLYTKNKTGIAYLLSALPLEEAVALLRSDFMEKGVLKLNSLRLTTIPEAVYALGQEIEQLILSNNGIKTIPNKIKQLTNLKVLDLSGNASMVYNERVKEKFKKLLPSCELKFRGY